MKVAFVFAPFWETKYPPLAPALLSAVLRDHGHEVVNFDANREIYSGSSPANKSTWEVDKILDEAVISRCFVGPKGGLIGSLLDRITCSGAKVVCFSIYDANRAFSRQIAKAIKARDRSLKIIFGGPACFFSYGALLKDGNVDFVIRGEGEETLPELIDCIRKGGGFESCRGIYFRKDKKILNTGSRAELDDLDKLPFPDFSGTIGVYKFQEQVILPIQASRGCINRCAFCNDKVYSERYRFKSPERIFEEMIHLRDKYSANRVVFHDSLLNGNMKMLERLCDLLIEEKLKSAVNRRRSGNKGADREIVWTGQAIVRPEMDLRVLKKMRQAGCESLQYGIESGSQRVLKSINKNMSTDVAIGVIRDTHNAGITCLINIMFGLPSEEEEDFQQTLDFIKKVKPYVDHVITAKTFCFLSPGSDMDRNPTRYGITRKHPLYWESGEGKNTYDIRFERYERCRRFAKKSGLEYDPGIEKMDLIKSLLIGNYLKYKGESAKNCKGFKKILDKTIFKKYLFNAGSDSD